MIHIFILFYINLVIPIVMGSAASFVTCGSAIKLINTDYKVRLHSHNVKYGSGSGQQSVTGATTEDDINSHWIIKNKTNEICSRGQPIKCGDIIRLEHLQTKKNLHSHLFSSALSGNQEISCYGKDGEGDTGDHWKVICINSYDKEWKRDSTIRLKHIDTSALLGVSGKSYGRSISGQLEVVGFPYSENGCNWISAEGVFIIPKASNAQNIHTEL